MKKNLTAILLSTILIGCASGTFTYIPPNESTPVVNSIVVDKSKDSVWDLLVAGLSSKYFVINTMDSKSGFINLNFSGDPEEYIDGGTIHSTFTNRAIDSTGTYDFPASRASVSYSKPEDGYPFGVTRTLALKGKINLLVAQVTSSSSRLTVTVNYDLTIRESGYADYHETLLFVTGESAICTFDSTAYRSNGKLEQSILQMVK